MIEIIHMGDADAPLLRFDVGPENERLTFHVRSTEVLRFEANGDIYVQGRLADSDKQVVDALRDWLARARRDQEIEP